MKDFIFSFNLLPWRFIKTKNELQECAKVIALSTIITITVVLCVHIYFKTEIRNLHNQFRVKEEQLSSEVNRSDNKISTEESAYFLSLHSNNQRAITKINFLLHSSFFITKIKMQDAIEIEGAAATLGKLFFNISQFEAEFPGSKLKIISIVKMASLFNLRLKLE